MAIKTYFDPVKNNSKLSRSSLKKRSTTKITPSPLALHMKFLNLQRLIGNHAICQMVSSSTLFKKQEMEGQDDTCGQKSFYNYDQISRTAENEDEKISAQRIVSPETEGNKENSIQTKREDNTLDTVSSELAGRIETFQSGGRPLSDEDRLFFEPLFGRDFGNVKIHTDSESAGTAHSLNAKAYTLGNHIMFGAGQYRSNSTEGRKLLAHELTHVIQQNHGAVRKLQCARLLDYANPTTTAHDPSLLTDTQIEATNEYKSYMNPNLSWQWKYHAKKDEALLACRLILRALREGKTIIWKGKALSYLKSARKQLKALAGVGAMKGQLKWVRFSSSTAATTPSALESEFGKWILAGGPQPSFTSGKINCWEVILFGAYKTGVTTKARIKQIYKKGVQKFKAGTATSIGDTVESELKGSKEYKLDLTTPGSKRPLPGDMIVFDRAANHAAIFLKYSGGKHYILSLWYRNAKKVEKVAIEDLVATSPALGSNIKFWSTKW